MKGDAKLAKKLTAEERKKRDGFLRDKIKVVLRPTYVRPSRSTPEGKRSRNERRR